MNGFGSQVLGFLQRFAGRVGISQNKLIETQVGFGFGNLHGFGGRGAQPVMGDWGRACRCNRKGIRQGFRGRISCLHQHFLDL